MTDGRLNQEVLSTLPDDELMTELTAVPGIGPWTVQDALLIALRREDVVLPGDLALRKAVQAAYELDHLPTQQEVLGHRREMAALPQPGDQLPALRRLRARGRGSGPCSTGLKH